jgi:hypothetical protein
MWTRMQDALQDLIPGGKPFKDIENKQSMRLLLYYQNSTDVQ